MTTCSINLQRCEENLLNWKSAVNHTAIVIETDDRGRITEVNDKFIEISGYSREESVDRTPALVDSAFHPPEFFTELWQAISQGQVWRGEIKNKRKDGSVYWVNTTITPILNAEGIPYKYIAIQFDITSQKQTEEKLTVSQRRFQQLAANLPGVIYQFLMRPDGYVFLPYISPGCRDFFEIEAESIENNAQVLINLIHPDDLPNFSRSVALSADTLEPWHWEGRFITPSGKVVWIEGHSRPEKQENGDILWDGLLIEITEGKMAQEALRKSEQRLGLHFQQTPLAVIEWDWNFEVMDWNPAAEKMFGYSKGEALNHHAVDLIVPKSAWEQVDQVFQALLQQTGGTRSTNDNFTKSGEIIVCEWYNTPLIDPNGTAIGVASLVQDITERQQYQDALKAANEVLEQRVEERTEQLQEAIAQLQGEMASRELVEEKYRSIFENAIMGIFQTTQEGEYISANPALARIYGYESAQELMQELRNVNYQLYVDKNRRNEFIEAIAQHGKISDFESQVYCKNGRIIWIAENARAVRDETGMLLYYEGTVEEITKRKQTEAALRRSEERLQEKALREALLNQLTEQIRQSLDLETILATTVEEIRELLQIELCYFSWYRPNGMPPEGLRSPMQQHDCPVLDWETVKEARSPGVVSPLGFYSVSESWSHQCLQLQPIRIDAVESYPDGTVVEIFRTWVFKSLLCLPLQTHSGQMGVLSCVHCSGERAWNESEVVLMHSISDRLTIAIDQAELYAQSRATAQQARDQAQHLEQALYQLQETQTKLIQTEKMSSLGQMVAGIAHEINNPVTFIHGNAIHATDYFKELLPLIELYQHYYPEPVPEIRDLLEGLDLAFILDDLPKALHSMKLGTERIRQIVLSLRNFSRLDESQKKPVDIHEGIDNTLLILQHRLSQIQVVKEYGKLPLIECYPGQLNQVFMNILANAIDAVEERKGLPGEPGNGKFPTPNSASRNPSSTINIHTELTEDDFVVIRIKDNGPGLTETVKNHLFDPFFTTKPVGKGTGLGLSISYQIIVEKHRGILDCQSQPGLGTEFMIKIPTKTGTK
ncbi:PAS domain S-box protein [Phormidium pseudopriestleyi FRX01]|uniref:histidine kinase n=1 Tax=Phormidium pseudopriestleyi FRX01 TaxID=1759528 RepID=A0ABS3FWU8_9CYAN|nr:PAS domain S-box protein [Phormidium pseudopriestleyi]MBO0351553.1 PAS domain S-box protein [Phormidium pseudopriestleyi FRX01]